MAKFKIGDMVEGCSSKSLLEVIKIYENETHLDLKVVKGGCPSHKEGAVFSYQNADNYDFKYSQDYDIY